MPLRIPQLILAYLALPVVIFWWGWFDSWVLGVGVVTVGWWIWAKGFSTTRLWHEERGLLKSFFHFPLPPFYFLLCMLALAWTYWGGVGGFRPQHFDYFKHNLILNNLVRYEWPVRYADGSYLCYYHAYYLPAAALAKVVGGVAMVKYYIFGWTWAGLTLLFVQLHRIGGLIFVLFFMLFNSPEAVLLLYEALKSPHTIAQTLTDLWTNDHTIELIQTPGGLMFPSMVESFTAAPQHSLPAWLGAVCLIHRLPRGRLRPIGEGAKQGWVVAGLCLYWSPLVAVGLLPLMVYDFYQSFNHRFVSLPSFLLHHISYIVFLGVLVVPVLVFYAGHVPMHDIHGWWWAFLKTPHQYALLATFWVLEVGIWAILFWIFEKKYGLFRHTKTLISLSLGILSILVLYRYGYFNDLARRACLPATLVICWGVYQLLVKIQSATTKHQKWLRFVCYFLLLPLLVLLPLKHHLRWLTRQPYTAIVDKKITDFTPYTIHYLSHYHWGEFDVVAQYLGKTDAIYNRVWAPSFIPSSKIITRAFYYWKSTFQLSDYEKQALNYHKINKLYIKFFDVDWDVATQRAVPKAPIRFAQASPLPFVPTVFVTNRTLEKVSYGGIEDLAKKITQRLKNELSQWSTDKGSRTSNTEKVGEEIQIDCDWTPATRTKYFLLLTKIKENLPTSTILSATIRLHQIKFYRTTGVPPVSRGMLMYYNMGDWKNPQVENSILDLSIARRYADYISAYPLDLDVVLPVFDWCVVFRGRKPIAIVNHLTHSDLSNHQYFKKSPQPNCYIATAHQRVLGIAVRRGDVFRVETCPVSNLLISSRTLSQEIQARNVTFALYHLDSTNLSRYASPTLRNDSLSQIFASFR